MAQLEKIITELRGMNDAVVLNLVRARLVEAAAPAMPVLRARILSIPTKGPKHTGLRIRIAACAEMWTEISGPRRVSVGIEINSARMPDGQKSLPLMMEGVKIWRHPLFGNRAHWYGQEAHPYFEDAAAVFAVGARPAIERAMDDISRRISG